MININIRINGNKTKNQAIPVAPALQIRFNIHVQNRMYKTFIKNINVVLVTSQL